VVKGKSGESTEKDDATGATGATGGELVGWLEFNVPFQHKYDYIRDEQEVIRKQND